MNENEPSDIDLRLLINNYKKVLTALGGWHWFPLLSSTYTEDSQTWKLQIPFSNIPYQLAGRKIHLSRFVGINLNA